MAPLSILIVDDDRLFADAVRVVLQDSGAAPVVVEQDIQGALNRARDEPPDVVLIEPDRTDGSPFGSTIEIVTNGASPKVVALTRSPRSAEHLNGGELDGVISKSCSPSELLPTIERILDGQSVDIEDYPRSAGSDESDLLGEMLQKKLTAREREILELLMQGFTSREIADHLSLTQNTVRTHVQSLLKKLQVHSRVEAAAFAAKHNLIHPRRQ